MLSLPPEILYIICELTSTSDLLAVRATSRSLCAVATPIAFRVLKFQSSKWSTGEFLALLESPVCAHVTEIIYLDRTIPYKEYPGVVAHANFIRGMEQLHRLEMLHTLSVTLMGAPVDPYDDYDANPEAHEDLLFQRRMLAGLAAVSPPFALRSLTLRGFLPVPDTIFSTPAFLALFQGLEHFCLEFACYSDQFLPLNQGSTHRFFTASLPLLLQSLSASLTSLSLRSDGDIGGIPGLALGELQYPSLEHLELTRILFDGITGAEAFILAHAPTLRSLRLDYCKVVLSNNAEVPERGWSLIYDALRASLVALTQLEVIENEMTVHAVNEPTKREKLRYVRWDPEGTWDTDVSLESEALREQSARDEQALEALKETVRAKN